MAVFRWVQVQHGFPRFSVHSICFHQEDVTQLKLTATRFEDQVDDLNEVKHSETSFFETGRFLLPRPMQLKRNQTERFACWRDLQNGPGGSVLANANWSNTQCVMHPGLFLKLKRITITFHRRNPNSIFFRHQHTFDTLLCFPKSRVHNHQLQNKFVLLLQQIAVIFHALTIKIRT